MRLRCITSRKMGRIRPVVRPLDAVEFDGPLEVSSRCDSGAPVPTSKLRWDSSFLSSGSTGLDAFPLEKRLKSQNHNSLFL